MHAFTPSIELTRELQSSFRSISNTQLLTLQQSGTAMMLQQWHRLFFYRWHPVVYILTCNILNYSSNTTQVSLHRTLKLGPTLTFYVNILKLCSTNNSTYYSSMTPTVLVCVSSYQMAVTELCNVGKSTSSFAVFLNKHEVYIIVYHEVVWVQYRRFITNLKTRVLFQLRRNIRTPLGSTIFRHFPSSNSHLHLFKLYRRLRLFSGAQHSFCI